MIISGTTMRDGTTNFLYVAQTKTSIGYLLISQYHKDDIFKVALGEEPTYQVLTENYLRQKSIPSLDYVVGALKSTTKEVLAYGNISEVEYFINVIQNSAVYSFKKKDVLTDRLEEDSKIFEARDDTLYVDYKAISSNIYSYLNIEMGNVELKLEKNYLKNLYKIKIPYETYTDTTTNRRAYLNIRQVTYAELRMLYDLDWQDSLDFKSVKSIQEFEDLVMYEFLEHYEQTVAKGDIVHLINDIESDGLVAFDLPDNLRNHICAISLAWSGDKSRLIFTDMEYHNNISIDYIKERLEPIFRYDFSKKNNKFTITCKGKTYYLDREKIKLVNTNTMFDQRFYLVHDIDIFYDIDLMMLFFALSPFHTKGKKSLKTLAEYFLKVKALSLKETLGAGNEDKFRWIQDEKVAIAYACPDTANLYKILFKVLKVYEDCKDFFHNDYLQTIQGQYPMIQYILAQSSFGGLRVKRKEFLEEGKAVKRKIELLEKLLRTYISYSVEKMKYKKIIHICKIRNIPIPEMDEPSILNVEPYSGKLRGDSMRTLLYDELKHPPIAMTKANKNSKNPENHIPKPSMSDGTIKELAKRKQNSSQKILAEDYLDPVTGEVLIEAKKLNECLYPIPYILTILTPLETEYKNYFKPYEVILEHSERLYKADSTTTIDTFRFSSPLQTIKASVKDLIISWSDEYTLIDWDKRQIELRVVAAISEYSEMIDILNMMESDIHRERAAIAYNKEPHLVTGDERNGIKRSVFGGIYGQGEYGLSYNLFGNANPYSLELAKLIYKAARLAFKPIFEFLDQVKEDVLVPQKLPVSLANAIGINPETPVGVVRSQAGYYKLFELTDLNDKKKKRIGNQAVNFPVQSFAGYIYKHSIIKLFLACWEKGWWQKKWYRFHLGIHDELLGSFKHKEIQLEELIETIVSCCVYKLPGHPAYYVGISVADSWYQCKEGIEMPTRLSLEIANNWRNGKIQKDFETPPVEKFNSLIKQFAKREIIKELKKKYPQIFKGELNVLELTEKFTNYAIIGYLDLVTKPLWKIEKGNSLDKLYSNIISFYLENIGEHIQVIEPENSVTSFLREDLAKREYNLGYKEFRSSSLAELILDSNIEYENIKAKMKADDKEWYETIKWSLEDDDNFEYDNYGEIKTNIEEKLKEEYETTDDDKILLVRKESKATYANIIVINNMAHVTVKNTGYIRHVLSEIPRLEKKYLFSQDRLQLLLRTKIGNTFITGPVVERRVLKDLDEMINEEA